VQRGRFNESWVVVGGRAYCDTSTEKIGANNRKLFSAIHFPFCFPRRYLSPYQDLFAPFMRCGAKLSSVGRFDVPRAVVNGPVSDHDHTRVGLLHRCLSFPPHATATHLTLWSRWRFPNTLITRSSDNCARYRHDARSQHPRRCIMCFDCKGSDY
jgi:hypothetical protein